MVRLGSSTLVVATLLSVLGGCWGTAAPAPKGPDRRLGGETCWQGARNPVGRAPQLVIKEPIQWRGNAPRWSIKLELRNTVDYPIWVNRRGSHGDGLPGEHELSVDVEPITGAMKDTTTHSHGEQPGLTDYVVVRPGDAIEMAAHLSATEYLLTPGEYKVRVCFWDAGPSAPPTPNGVTHFRGPVVAGPAMLVRGP
jgi:hypothetical protein